jgi:hypothetical protein
MIGSDDEMNLLVAELRGLHPQVSPAWREQFGVFARGVAANLDRMATWFRANDADLWRISCHEAGHALAAYLACHDLRSASVIPAGNSGGRVLFRSVGVDDFEERLLILIAGPMAAHLIAGGLYWLAMGTNGDGDQVADLLAAHDDRFTYAAGFERNRHYLAALQRTREFVEGHRRTIMLLAEMLCEYRILGPMAIDETFSIPIFEAA